MNYYSQFGQDKEVERLINTRGFFIEAGSYDGITESNTKRFEELGWNGLCVEPCDIFYEKCKINRSCLTLNVVLYDKDDEEIIFVDGTNVNRPCHSGIKGTLSSSLKSEYTGTSMVKKTKMLGTILRENFPDLKVIDFLSLDTEGSEYNILKDFPFDDYRFKIVCVEHNFVEETRRNLFELFHSKGYQLHIPLIERYDDWYVAPEVAKYHICLGIGDILLLAGWFKKNNYSGTLVISLEIIRVYRNNSMPYLNFILRLIKEFMPQFSIEFGDKIEQTVSINNFIKSENWLKANDFKLGFPKSENLWGDYVVLFTKYRFDEEKSRIHFNNCLPALIEIISGLKKKIVLLGEREISPNFETDYHKVSTLYEKLKPYASIDLTEKELTNDWNIFTRDVQIIQNAKCVIGFGLGGNLCMSIAFSQKFIFFTETSSYKITEILAKDSSNILTFDVDIFRNYLTRLDNIKTVAILINHLTAGPFYADLFKKLGYLVYIPLKCSIEPVFVDEKVEKVRTIKSEILDNFDFYQNTVLSDSELKILSQFDLILTYHPITINHLLIDFRTFFIIWGREFDDHFIGQNYHHEVMLSKNSIFAISHRYILDSLPPNSKYVDLPIGLSKIEKKWQGQNSKIILTILSRNHLPEWKETIKNLIILSKQFSEYDFVVCGRNNQPIENIRMVSFETVEEVYDLISKSRLGINFSFHHNVLQYSPIEMSMIGLPFIYKRNSAVDKTFNSKNEFTFEIDSLKETFSKALVGNYSFQKELGEIYEMENVIEKWKCYLQECQFFR